MRLKARNAALTAVLVTALMTPLGASRLWAAGFGDVVAAMDAEDWDAAYLLAAGHGDVAQTLVTWERLRSGAGIFAEYPAFLLAHPDWPGLALLRAEGERLIPEDAAPAEIIAYFTDAPPQTGEGVARLAAAYQAFGQPIETQATLTDAWLTLGLDETGFAALMPAYAEALAPLHGARADALLWRGRTTDTAQLLPFVADADRPLIEARLALATNAPDRNARVAAVPAALRENPGLAYDRFNRMAASGDYSDAVALLAARSGSADALGQPFRWASWRTQLARWAMREGRADEAYALATAHHLHPTDTSSSEAEFYADLEWLAGYLSLRYLNAPEQALTHFARVAAASSGPISLSRAHYWIGRTQEALGDAAAAQTAFSQAADYQTAFYGLLAAERLGRPLDPALAGAEAFPDWRGAAFLGTEMGQAMVLMLDAGDRAGAVPFIQSLAQSLDRTGLGQLGTMMADRQEPYFTVLVGKTAVVRGMTIPAIYFPLHPLAQTDLPVTAELALSIARRESEFNFTVGSPVGALGLMQLMPGTAQEVAEGLGLPYSRARLTSEWQYNAVLGSAYLAELEKIFGDSPVLIAAGYNAGPSRPMTWMAQRGDPRKGEIDVIDWIEHIPFTETRNYVMRVTESIPVYRARLTGETGPIRFTQMLNGEVPLIRPVARPLAHDVTNDGANVGANDGANAVAGVEAGAGPDIVAQTAVDAAIGAANAEAAAPAAATHRRPRPRPHPDG